MTLLPQARRHRRIGIFLLLVASVLAGCGASGPADEVSPADGARAETPSSEPTQETVEGVTTGEPARILIPSIEVDAAVIDLNLATDGTLEVPRVPADTGWWREGPDPGERGAAVIVGHVDSRTGPAVFYDLRKLQQGDEITVISDLGARTSFVVERLARHPKDQFPTQAVYGLTTEPELRLVTCDGWFDRGTGHYVDNLVVYATLREP